MRMSMGLEAKQVQTYQLAPKMIQSMEILQLPVMALQERVEQEMNENPVLEMAEEDPAAPEEPVESDEPVHPDAPTVDEKEIVVDEAHDNADDFERLFDLSREVPDFFDDGPSKSVNRLEEEAQRKHDALANIAVRSPSLNEHLLQQLGELDVDEEIAELARRIISMLDAEDGGYFKGSLLDLLPPSATAEDQEKAEEALRLVQSLDPPGIAARDLRECLLLQLSPDMPYYEEVKTLIEDHLEDLRDNRLPQIQKKTGFSIQRIQEAWNQLKKLNPKPGAIFAESHVAPVTPDVILEQDEDGTYRVVVEDQRLPRLYISPYYWKRLQDGTATREEKEYLRKKITSAQWLIDAIEQRKNTLTRVAQAIVDHQREFLEKGPEFIKPLKMQQIADQVGVHVTTISRAVDDKWIQTPRGIFPLRRFFVGGTRTEQGEDVAWDRIRIKLQELIDKEDKRRPYSDDELVKELGKQGIKVARRTITKYRQKMGIPSSRQRRDWSKVEAD
ncbi:MAG TPA: RNA polymerase sigma-54 factor [Planctomycetaceae bacterium]|nr:RNA polymerase sigma-54 factor [Planctomycetaceae bacterium]